MSNSAPSPGGIVGIIPGQAKNISLTLNGSLVVGVKQLSFMVNSACTISAVYAKVDIAPTGADLQIDVNKNGTTIFTTQSNRPIIVATGTTDLSGTPDVTGFAQYDILSIDIDQVGSTVAGGSNLYLVFTLT